MSYQNLIEQLVANKTLKTPRIIEAFKKVDRTNFMLPEYRQEADIDVPFPIPAGQTISQPTTVAFMIELLQPRPNQKILDIGAGSGWTTAILAEIVGPKGKVIGAEIIKEVYEFGKNNIEKSGYQNIEYLNIDASGGYEKEAPFDRILGSASIPQIPEILKRQLKLRGRLVIPVQDSVVLLERISKNKFKKAVFPFFAFVPMTGKYGRAN